MGGFMVCLPGQLLGSAIEDSELGGGNGKLEREDK
jgi:hypothetical protein